MDPLGSAPGCNCRHYLHCSLMQPQAKRSQQSNPSIIALKGFRNFAHTVQICGNIPTGRSGVMRMTMHRNHTHNFRFQIMRQKIVSTYIIATCCNSHVKENMLSSNCFNSIQVKTICWLAKFMVSLQNYMYHFDTQKRLKNTMVVTRVFFKVSLW